MRFCYLWVVVSLLSVSSLSAQAWVVWRGFAHDWTYNHRINRLGDYVQSLTDSFRVGHCAASGLGADSSFFTSYYSVVSKTGLGAQYGRQTLRLMGREGELLTLRQELAVPAQAALQGLAQYEVLLNGFDLRASSRADRVQLLRLAVERVYYAPATQELRFTVHLALVMNCQSIECPPFNQMTTYEVDVHYLLLGGAQDAFLATQHQVNKHYTWNKKIMPEENNLQLEVHGQGNNHYPVAALGVRSLGLTLDKAHWMVNLHQHFTPLSYEGQTGAMRLHAGFFFGEWRHGMKRYSAYRKHSRFSKRSKGWAILEADLVLLQLRQGEVKHQQREGRLFWRGFNQPCDDPAAESSEVYKF